jgi:hypothetical protein
VTKLEASQSPEHIVKWKAMIRAWTFDPLQPDPYEEPKEGKPSPYIRPGVDAEQIYSKPVQVSR